MDYFALKTVSDLEKMVDNEKNPAIKLKLLVVWHKKRGEKERYISSITRVPRATVGYWVRQFRKYGIKGLRRKPGAGGQNRYLTKQQEHQLRNKLKQQPMTSREVWTYIKENFGREYHPNSIPRLLRRLGQSLITPRPRNYKANPRSGWAFKGHIKKVEFVEI